MIFFFTPLPDGQADSLDDFLDHFLWFALEHLRLAFRRRNEHFSRLGRRAWESHFFCGNPDILCGPNMKGLTLRFHDAEQRDEPGCIDLMRNGD